MADGAEAAAADEGFSNESAVDAALGVGRVLKFDNPFYAGDGGQKAKRRRRKAERDKGAATPAKGGDTAISNALEYEDEFTGKYGLSGQHGGASIIEPPFLPKTLENWVLHNNALLPCIDAMVTNVHETGFEIEPVNGDMTADAAANDPELKRIKAFFDETWPGQTFLQLRKQIGQDVEKTGNGYVEVIRNLRGEMVLLRRLDPKLTRVVKITDAQDVPVTIQRGEEQIVVNVSMRYRRFVMSIGTKFVYFKEFGCPLPIDKTNGDLAPLTERFKMIRDRKLGSEIIHFTKVPDIDTPYGLPQWTPQIPSVTGARKAEEHNLGFFDNGGVPPMMIFVTGGTLAKEARTEIQRFMSGNPGGKHMTPVFEIADTKGMVGQNSNVRVTVERFGSERQKDSLFENYDLRCEKRVRSSWRLPSMFVGASDDYNFATAYASCILTEAQVFKPERDEFDALVNSTIMRELGGQKYKFRSKPLPIKDVEQQLKAIDSAATKGYIDAEEAIRLLNEITSLNMKVSDEPSPKPGSLPPPPIGLDGKPIIPVAAGGPKAAEPVPPKGKTPKPGEKPALKAEVAYDAPLDVADRVYEAVRLNQYDGLFAIMGEVAKFDHLDAEAFRMALSDRISEGSVQSDVLGRMAAASLVSMALA
jgi:PBSX family phage portal protein